MIKEFLCPEVFLLNTAEHENYPANKYQNAKQSHFHIYKQDKFHAQLRSAGKKNVGTCILKFITRINMLYWIENPKRFITSSPDVQYEKG